MRFHLRNGLTVNVSSLSLKAHGGVTTHTKIIIIIIKKNKNVEII